MSSRDDLVVEDDTKKAQHQPGHEDRQEDDQPGQQAGIFPENKTSIQLHKNLGFREVGYREKIGQLNGHWRDVMLLERRSQRVNFL